MLTLWRQHRFCEQAVLTNQTDTWLAKQSEKELRELWDQDSDRIRCNIFGEERTRVRSGTEPVRSVPLRSASMIRG